MTHLNKYLANYASTEVENLNSIPPHFSFTQCIVIPACNEKSDFVERLALSPLSTGTLLILVVNQSANACEQVHDANRALVNVILSGEELWSFDNLSLCTLHSLHILLVDRFSVGREIPEKDGVGRARKTGCDLAVKLFSMNKLQSPWIFSTDADASLPENYFSTTSSTAAAQVFNFQHKGESGLILDATLLYEQAIKYYQSALAWSGSPYAYHTLGSTLAVEVEAYCKVRGFPPRAGGEDFYLLNKLAKIGEIRSVNTVTIQLDARLSERVPFGTGPAVKKIMETLNSKKEFSYYNPAIFRELRILLTHLHLLHKALEENLPIDSQVNSRIAAALGHLKIDRFSQHCKTQAVQEKDFSQQFHTWFDGFITLKFVHFLQKEFYPALPIDECEYGLKQFELTHA